MCVRGHNTRRTYEMIVFDCSFSQPDIVSVPVDCRYPVCPKTNHDVRSCIRRIVITRVVVCLEKCFEKNKINTNFVAFWCTKRKSKRKIRREIWLPKNHTHPVHTNVSVGFSTRIIRIVKHKSYACVRPPSFFGQFSTYFISFFFYFPHEYYRCRDRYLLRVVGTCTERHRVRITPSVFINSTVLRRTISWEDLGWLMKTTRYRIENQSPAGPLPISSRTCVHVRREHLYTHTYVVITVVHIRHWLIRNVCA